jgi:DNA-directed RNA polymerase specialized sigma24 family protein
VSDRPRRAGARPGQLSDAARDALRDEIARLGAIRDPVEAMRAVSDAFAALDAELDALAIVRLRAVQALRDEGWSYQDIADATGVSKGRVAQLARDPRARVVRQPRSKRATGAT